MKRRDTKQEIHWLEKQLLPVVQRYLRAGEPAHSDVIHQYESQIEVKLYYLLGLYLRLDPSWPSQARWLDGFEDFVWARTATSLRGRCDLWWGHVANIAGAQVKEPFRIILGTRKRKRVVYLGVLGEGESLRYFSNHGSGISYRGRGYL